MPRRCLHGVHRNSSRQSGRLLRLCLGAACTGCIDLRDHFFIRCDLCLGAACTGCIPPMEQIRLAVGMPLPRRCLHGVHHIQLHHAGAVRSFASALPARGASPRLESRSTSITLCLGAACTGCIKRATCLRPGQDLCLGAACTGCITSRSPSFRMIRPLPRRCLHGVHPRGTHPNSLANLFASALPARGASAKADKLRHTIL